MLRMKWFLRERVNKISIYIKQSIPSIVIAIIIAITHTIMIYIHPQTLLTQINIVHLQVPKWIICPTSNSLQVRAGRKQKRKTHGFAISQINDRIGTECTQALLQVIRIKPLLIQVARPSLSYRTLIPYRSLLILFKMWTRQWHPIILLLMRRIRSFR